MENIQSLLPQPIQNPSHSRLPLALLIIGLILLIITILSSFAMMITINQLYTLYEGLNVQTPLSRTQAYLMTLLAPLVPLGMTLYGFYLYRKQKHGIVLSTRQNQFANILIMLPVIGFVLAIPLFVISAIKPLYLLFNEIGIQSSHTITISPTSVPQLNPTANWKTYEDKELQLQLKHPYSWTMKKLIKTIVDAQENNTSVLRIEYFDNPTNLSLTQYEQKIENSSSLRGSPGIGAQGAQLVSSQDALTVYYQKQYPCEPQFCEAYIIVGNKKIVILQAYPEKLNKNTLDQILSSFKFLDQEQTSLNGSGSSTSNTFYNDTYFSVEVPTLLYASPQVNTKINGGYEVVTFANKLPYFSVQVTPDTPSMHNTFPSDKQILFGGFDAVLSPVIAGVGADIYQPTVTFFTKGRANVITVGIQDTKENRDKADQFIQQLSKSFKVL